MDIITTTYEGDVTERYLGRDTLATMRLIDEWSAFAPTLPRLFSKADLPEVSPPIWRYCPGGYDNQWIGMCFPAGTPVRLADGSERAIEDVAVGDRVVTHASGGRQVVRTFRRLYDGDLVTVDVGEAAPPLPATADHPFAVPAGDDVAWVKASDLRTGDKVIVKYSGAGVSEPHPAGRVVRVQSLTVVAVTGLPVFDIEVEEDHSFVANGLVVHNCVGKGTKNGASTVLRIPEGAAWDPAKPDQFTAPLPTIQLSGLYSYWVARNTRGRAPWGEGAVVAYALEGSMKFGLVRAATWLETQAAQRAYSDSRKPNEAMFAEGSQHIPLHWARITTREDFFGQQALGRPVVYGVGIGNGWNRTREDGYFSLRGLTMGGHCVLAVGYDRTKNRQYSRNSWAGWGMLTNDPEFQGEAGGRNNVGWTDLDEFEDRYLTDQKLKSGETDAFVVDSVPGFDKPKIQLISAVELFT